MQESFLYLRLRSPVHHLSDGGGEGSSAGVSTLSTYCRSRKRSLGTNLAKRTEKSLLQNSTCPRGLGTLLLVWSRRNGGRFNHSPVYIFRFTNFKLIMLGFFPISFKVFNRQAEKISRREIYKVLNHAGLLPKGFYKRSF